LRGNSLIVTVKVTGVVPLALQTLPIGDIEAGSRLFVGKRLFQRSG
jgi:hypothetical protein